MERFTLNAQVRPAGTKNVARKVRKAGDSVGVVYRAGQTATPVRFEASALAAIFRKSENPNVLIDVNIDGTTRTCLAKEVQRHPVSRTVEHVDFVEVARGDVVRVDVPIQTVGRAAGTRQGGTLRVLTRSVTVTCDPFLIPATMDIDVTPVEVGQFIKVSQVPAPEGVSVNFTRDFNILTVEGKRTGGEDAPAAAAAAPAAAAKGAPAAKAAAPAAKAPAKK